MFLALLASTDFVIGMVTQTVFMVVIILFLLEEPSGIVFEDFSCLY